VLQGEGGLPIGMYFLLIALTTYRSVYIWCVCVCFLWCVRLCVCVVRVCMCFWCVRLCVLYANTFSCMRAFVCVQKYTCACTCTCAHIYTHTFLTQRCKTSFHNSSSNVYVSHDILSRIRAQITHIHAHICCSVDSQNTSCKEVKKGPYSPAAAFWAVFDRPSSSVTNLYDQRNMSFVMGWGYTQDLCYFMPNRASLSKRMKR